ncbi:MAG: hypothetical protein OHK0012_02240 [Synechococcales cyanobacterium]
MFDSQTAIPSNYYAPSVYVQGDLESGLLSSRRGDRLLALPQPLIEAIYSGLEYETGQAMKLVLRHCGRMWGKEFFRRFANELTDYHHKSLTELEMGVFLQNLQQAWKTHGWGTFAIDWSYQDQGLLVVHIQNSPFTALFPADVPRPMGYLEAGMLATWFSQLTGRELNCVQTTSMVLGAPVDTFVITAAERLKDAETWVDNGQTHDQVVQQLLAG